MSSFIVHKIIGMRWEAYENIEIEIDSMIAQFHRLFEKF